MTTERVEVIFALARRIQDKQLLLQMDKTSLLALKAGLTDAEVESIKRKWPELLQENFL